ncbi:MAG: hypothetical protein P8X57_07430 [Cyclobacteriaceae bacterium]
MVAFIRGERKYIVVFAVVALICFLFLPSKLPGQTPLFERFSTWVLLALILLISTVVPDRKSLRFFIPAVLGLYVIAWTEYFVTFNQVNEEFDKEFLAELGRDDMLYGLIYDHTFRGRPVYIHYPNYHTVWNHGPASSKIIDYRFGIIRRKINGRPIPRYNEWIGIAIDTVESSPANYILVHGEGPVKDKNLDGFRQVGQAGNWFLYGSVD